MGHDYSYSQPSSTSPSLVGRSESNLSLSSARNRRHPIPRNMKLVDPRNCDCGGRVRLVSDPEFSNGRLYYKCENLDLTALSGGVHTIKSWDKHVLDILEEINNCNRSLEERMDMLTRGPEGENIEPSVIWSQLNFQGNHIKELEDNVEGVYLDLKDDIAEISAMLSRNHSAGWMPTTPARKHVICFAIGFLLLACCYSASKLV